MQVQSDKSLPERMIYYASMLTAESTKKKTSYNKMRPKIIIFILNDTFFNFDEPIQETTLVLKKHKEHVFSNLHKYYVVELSKLNKIDNQRLKIWSAFLNQDKEMVTLMSKEDEILRKAVEQLEELCGNEEVVRIAESRRRAILNENTRIEEAERKGHENGLKKGFEEGIEKGIEKGIKEGKKEGIKEGIKKGKEQGKKENQKEMIIEMHKNGIDTKTISKVTKLTIKEIEDIINNGK